MEPMDERVKEDFKNLHPFQNLYYQNVLITFLGYALGHRVEIQDVNQPSKYHRVDGFAAETILNAFR